MKAFAVGSLNLVQNNQPSPGYILQTPIKGLDSPEYRTNAYDRPGADGATVSNMFYGSRIIVLTGLIVAENPTNFEKYRSDLARAMSIQKDANGYPTPTRITFSTLGNKDYFVDAYPDKPEFDYDMPNSARFMLTFTATNPMLYNPVQITSAAVSRPIGGGYVVPMILPYTSAASSGGSILLTNAGDVPAWPVVTLYGPLTNPIIKNMTNGKTLSLNYTLTAGNTLTIDMAEKSIKLNNSSSVISSKSSDSDWWALETGSNQVALDSSSSSDTGYMILSYYTPYLAA